MPPLLIGIAQIWQESNGCNPLATTIDDFKSFVYAEEQQVLENVTVAVHHCTHDARYITGAVLSIDGGMKIMVNTPYPIGYVEGGAYRE